MACSQTFQVSQDKFEAGSKQLNLSGNTGPFNYSGVKGMYNYIAGVLTVLVTSKPFIIPCSAIFSKIADALK
jgi:hypothetical protein